MKNGLLPQKSLLAVVIMSTLALSPLAIAQTPTNTSINNQFINNSSLNIKLISDTRVRSRNDNSAFDAYGRLNYSAYNAIIDLPQAVDASANNNAKWMFERDVNNMAQYYGRYAPEVLETQYGKEMWALFQAGTLTPETELTGVYIESEIDADIDGLMAEINAVMAEAELRRARFMDEINEDEGE